ncbi:MAG: response regulator, partial [Lachnospiraceae bacterium]|nr:response regulator [Lachnospiraceae bacterium]
MSKICIIEDDESIRQELTLLLKNAGYETAVIRDFQNTAKEILKAEADLILLDINLPGANGEQLL